MIDDRIPLDDQYTNKSSDRAIATTIITITKLTKTQLIEPIAVIGY